MLGTSTKANQELGGKPFPCPTCAMALMVKLSKNEKPYCICNECGIQLFFRGQTGIRLLRNIISSEKLIAGTKSTASDAITLHNRWESLRSQKRDLESKQGLILTDKATTDAISAVQSEILHIEKELQKLAKGKEKHK